MATINDLVTRKGVEEQVQGVGAVAWYGTVVAPAPTAYNAPLWVDIPDMSWLGQVKWGPCFWSSGLIAQPPVQYPHVGSPVLVIFDNRNQPWVVAIWQ